MGDRLERFIIENRDSFNDEIPDKNTWDGIQARLRKKMAIGWWQAAAVIFLAGNIIQLLPLQPNTSSQSDEYQAMGYLQVEQFYVELINQKKNELIAEDYLGVSAEIIPELEYLDETYHNLKGIYFKKVSDEKLMDAMIENLQIRIELLNKQLWVLEELKQPAHNLESENT